MFAPPPPPRIDASGVRVMMGVLVQGRVRINIRIRVRFGVMFNVSIYHIGAIIVAGANVVHSITTLLFCYLPAGC